MPKFYVQVFVSYIKISKGLSLLKLIIWVAYFIRQQHSLQGQTEWTGQPTILSSIGQITEIWK